MRRKIKRQRVYEFLKRKQYPSSPAETVMFSRESAQITAPCIRKKKRESKSKLKIVLVFFLLLSSYFFVLLILLLLASCFCFLLCVSSSSSCSFLLLLAYLPSSYCVHMIRNRNGDKWFSTRLRIIDEKRSIRAANENSQRRILCKRNPRRRSLCSLRGSKDHLPALDAGTISIYRKGEGEQRRRRRRTSKVILY